MDVDSATYDMVAQCGAGDQPKLDLLSRHTRLLYLFQVRTCSEPLDLPFLPLQTNFIQSVAAVEADVDSATYDMVAQCVAGGQPKFNLLSIYIGGCNIVFRLGHGLSRLIYLSYYLKQTLLYR